MTDQGDDRFVNPQTTIGILCSSDRLPLTPHGIEPSVCERHHSPAVTAVRLITMYPEGQIPTTLPGTDRWPVLMTEIAEITDYVRTQAVPRLLTGTGPMEPVLHVHFEIVAGHADELRAIIDGSMSTAGMRYENRLGATFARMTIPEWLSQVDGAPDAQQIAQLLDQLSVHEVLDRMRRWTPSFDYGTDTALHIVEVIKELQDEAAEFVSGGLSVQQNGTV